MQWDWHYRQEPDHGKPCSHGKEFGFCAYDGQSLENLYNKNKKSWYMFFKGDSR